MKLKDILVISAIALIGGGIMLGMIFLAAKESEATNQKHEKQLEQNRKILFK